MKGIITFLFAALFAACSPQISVFSDQDPEYDLSTYETFHWGEDPEIEEGKNPLHYNELNDKRIKTAVQAEMSARGHRFQAESRELILHYHIIVDNQSVVTTEPLGYRYGPYWTRMNTNIYSYREGTLIIDVMDGQTQNLIWRGWAVMEVSGIDPEKIDGLIKTTVAKIFTKYPKSSAE